MNCCDHTCNEGRDCPNRMLTNTHRVVAPYQVWREEDAWKDPGAQRFVWVCVLATVAACVLAVLG